MNSTQVKAAIACGVLLVVVLAPLMGLAWAAAPKASWPERILAVVAFLLIGGSITYGWERLGGIRQGRFIVAFGIAITEVIVAGIVMAILSSFIAASTTEEWLGLAAVALLLTNTFYAWHFQGARFLTVHTGQQPSWDDSEMRDNVPVLEAIVHEYGEVVSEVSAAAVTQYPAFVFPESLLPHPRSQIEYALNWVIRYTNQDEPTMQAFKSTLALLDSFIEDQEASRRNGEMLRAMQKAGAAEEPKEA